MSLTIGGVESGGSSPGGGRKTKTSGGKRESLPSLNLQNAPLATRVASAEDALAAGVSLEDLLGMVEPDVAAAIADRLPATSSESGETIPGGFDILRVPLSLRSDAQTVNRLLRRLDGLKGSPEARKSVEAVIARLSAKIRKGMPGG